MSDRLIITDHALLRFLERGCGLDVEGLRETLQDSLNRAQASAQAIGESDYNVLVGDSVFLVRSGVLKTVLEDTSVGKRARALKRDAE
ncbi:MAG: hypothetical protein AAF707_00200 [Pseudomonadota bacterium]